MTHLEEKDEEISRLNGEIRRLQNWVNDLQSGMFINCAYCGHRYGPDDEVGVTMQEALYEHIKECPKHPLSKTKNAAQQAITVLREALIALAGTDNPQALVGIRETLEEVDVNEDIRKSTIAAVNALLYVPANFSEFLENKPEE